jgi:uncharacterized protein DUF551
MKWISVEDKLPKEGTKCLVIVRVKTVNKKDTCPWIQTKKYRYKKGWGFITKDVEYWIRIPKIPKDVINAEFCNIED